MRARVRFVGLLMAIVLLVAVVAAIAGPEVYIVTLDDQGNSYYLPSNGDGTLGPQEVIGNIPTYSNYGAGMGYFTTDMPEGNYYDFVVGTGYVGSPPQDILLYEKKTSGNAFIGPSKVGDWSSSSGLYPGDMPVANFDGTVFDPNALDDFIMVRYGTQDVGLYLNQGNGVFIPSEITNAAPAVSYGADVADINHDGYADFVVAPADGTSIFVNIRQEDGTFETTEIPTNGIPYWGITAADFDGDYKVELIATSAIPNSYSNGFDYFDNDGSGGFTYVKRFGEGLISPSSPVDNYDLDGFGDQDLVVSNLINYPDGVPDPSAVIVGTNYDGLGNFTFSTPITGNSMKALDTIAAPPVFQNEAPVAVVSVSAVDSGVLYDGNVIIAGTTLKFSSYDPTDVSYDPEGKELEYSWSFGDSSPPETGVDVTHSFNTAGSYGVTLTLTDNYDATTEKTVTINVNSLPVAVDDMYSTDMNAPLTIAVEDGVLVNDNDDGYLYPLKAILVTGPGLGPDSGMVALNADGSFKYTPSDDFTGTDFFTYKVNDGLEDSADTATVTIAVNSPAFEAWDVNIFPNMINLKSRGVFIAFITLPKPYSAKDVQEGSVYCQGEGQAVDQKAVAIRLIRHAKFPQAFGAIFRTADMKGVQVGTTQTFFVNGTAMYEGLSYAFSGDDTVRVFTLKTKVRDDTEGWEHHHDKKLWDDLYKGSKNNKDRKDNR